MIYITLGVCFSIVVVFCVSRPLTFKFIFSVGGRRISHYFNKIGLNISISVKNVFKNLICVVRFAINFFHFFQFLFRQIFQILFISICLVFPILPYFLQKFYILSWHPSHLLNYFPRFFLYFYNHGSLWLYIAWAKWRVNT